jgi:hypothetical protein
MNFVKAPEFKLTCNPEFSSQLENVLDTSGDYHFLIQRRTPDIFVILDRNRFKKSILRVVFKMKRMGQFTMEAAKLGYYVTQNGCSACPNCMVFQQHSVLVSVNYSELQNVLEKYRCQIELLQGECAQITKFNQNLLREFRPWKFQDPFI